MGARVPGFGCAGVLPRRLGKEELVRLYEAEELSVVQIAFRWGLRVGNVRSRLVALGVALRVEDQPLSRSECLRRLRGERR